MAAANTQETYSYQFRVSSLDPSQPVSEVVSRINNLAPQMAGELKDYGNKLRVSVKREKTIPVDPVTVLILIELADLTLKPLVEGFFHKLGEKMAGFLTGEVDNAQISVEKEPTPPDQKEAKQKPVAKDKKKKNKK